MKLRTTHLLLLLSVILASCEKVVEFDMGDIEPHIVVNALPCTDSMLFVNVTYSRFFLDNTPFRPVTDANVTVDVGGTTYTSTSRDGANYLFAYQATAGDTLTLHVNMDGCEEIIAGTRIPDFPAMQPPLAEIDTLQPISLGNVTFTIDDPAGKNYYYIYLMERDSGSRWNRWEEKWDTIDTIRHAYFNCLNKEITNPEVNSMEGLMDYFESLLFTDAAIDGQSYEVTLSLTMFKDTAEHPLLREYTLVVESLSPEAHQYMKDVAVSQGMASYFAEPAQIYSNLSNGLGIFAAIAHREYALTFTYKEPDGEKPAKQGDKKR